MRSKHAEAQYGAPPVGLADPVKPAGSTALLAEFLATTGPEDIYRSNTQPSASRTAQAPPTLKSKRSAVNLGFLRKRPSQANQGASREPALPSMLDKRYTSAGKQFFVIRDQTSSDTNVRPVQQADVPRTSESQDQRKPLPKRPQRPEGFQLPMEEAQTQEVKTRVQAIVQRQRAPLLATQTGLGAYQQVEYAFGRDPRQRQQTQAESQTQTQTQARPATSDHKRASYCSASTDDDKNDVRPSTARPLMSGGRVTTTITGGAHHAHQSSRQPGASSNGYGSHHSMTGSVHSSIGSDADRPLSLDDSLSLLASMSDAGSGAECASVGSVYESAHDYVYSNGQLSEQLQRSDDEHAAQQQNQQQPSPALSGVSPCSPARPFPTQQQAQPFLRPTTPPQHLKPRAGSIDQTTQSPSSVTGKLRQAAAAHSASLRQAQGTSLSGKSSSDHDTLSSHEMEQDRHARVLRQAAGPRPVLIAPRSPERERLPGMTLPDTPVFKEGAVPVHRPASYDSGVGKTPDGSEGMISALVTSSSQRTHSNGAHASTGDEALKDRLAKLEERNEALERVLMNLLSHQLGSKTGGPPQDMAQVKQALGRLA